jgi:type III pantothenate kinase
MLLAIDVGNTTIALGVFESNKLKKRYSIATNSYKYGYSLRKIFKSHRINDAIVSSVVPKATRELERQLRELLKKPPMILGKNLNVPIKNLYRFPEQVGQDRLVNGFAAVNLYGTPAIVVDFGTAITFDVISRKKEYLGGMILPGLRISLETLNERTALLPKIQLEKPEEFIGRDTKNSMLSGIVYGFAALSDDLTERIKKTIGKNARVIGTGGNIDLIDSYCSNFKVVDKDLTIKGLNLIYRTLII